MDDPQEIPLQSRQHSKETIQVAFLVPSLRLSGAHLATIRIANLLANRGLNVLLITISGKTCSLDRAIQENVTVIHWHINPIWKGLSRLIPFLRNSPPDILVAVQPIACSLAGIAKFLCHPKTKVIMTEHATRIAHVSTPNQAKRILVRIALWLGYQFADAYVGVSRASEIALRKFLALPIQRTIKVIYNPVYCPQFQALSEESIQEKWFEASHEAIIAVGRLSEEKGFDILIKAFALIPPGAAARFLYIIGEGEGRTELEKLVKKLDLSGRVVMPGEVDNPLKFLRRASLFVLSSRHEALPTVLIEALGCNTPIVSTDVGGVREILGKNFGTIIPSLTPKTLANAIERALKSDSQAREMEKAISRSALFSYERACNEYLGLFESVLPSDKSFSKTIKKVNRSSYAQ